MWRFKERERSKCLEIICGLTMFNIVKNEEMERKIVVRGKMGDRVNRNVSKWFGHTECVSDKRLTRNYVLVGRGW